jgi:thiamine transport system ATP-binding protein
MRVAVEGLAVAIDGRAIIEGVDLDVVEGERLALLGPSGSGKSTLLRAIAGLRTPSVGRVLLDGEDARGRPTHERGIGLVFQDGALFPHRDVAGNVGYGLEVAGVGARERRARVAEALELVGLAGAGPRAVDTLSGGEAQRVALARALAPRPRALLLDEPLGALDGPLRERLQDELRHLCDALRLTAIHVTHDVAEAFAVGHRVAVLLDGVLAQVATPEQLWRAPADERVARFLGMRNLRTDAGSTVLVRPEAVLLHDAGDATVLDVALQGPTATVTVRLPDGETLEAILPSRALPTPGDRVRVEIDPDGVVPLPARSAGSAQGDAR